MNEYTTQDEDDHFQRGREQAMLVSLREVLFLMFMVLALLMGLFGWNMKMMISPFTHPHYTVPMYSPICPPPPYEC